MRSSAALNLGKYQILKKLASGGMAEIHLAVPKVFSKTPENSKQMFVIKRVIDGTGAKPDFITGLKDEAKALGRLRHPNIVAFKEFVEEEDQCYLVMEYVEGKSLAQFCQIARDAKIDISIDHALYLVSEIATGLDYAHNCYDQYFQKFLNLVHRDINPQNIMIADTGEVKIIDFGISKFDFREVRTQTGFVKGKVSYLSPEQIEHRLVDARTDVYALGVVLWELLAGRRLFDGQSTHEKVDKIRNSQIPSLTGINPKVSEKLNDIVKKALEFRLDKRYQSAIDFKYDLISYMTQHFPSYNAKNFRDLVAQFKSVKVIKASKTQSDVSMTEKIELPSGLYTSIAKQNVIVDMNQYRLNAASSSLLKRTKKKKKKKKKRRLPPDSLLDIFFNSALLAAILAALGYYIYFIVKTGHYKVLVAVLKHIVL